MEDCIFLLADGQMEQVFKGFLERANMHMSLGVRPFTSSIIVDRELGDSGVYIRGQTLLRSHCRTNAHAVAVLDHAWEGAPPVEVIRTTLKEKLCSNGWQEGQVEVIVIKPELEIWLWQDSPHIAQAMRFNHAPHPTLRKWLEQKGLWSATDAKPERPKEALEAVMRFARMPRSGAIYASISKQMSVQRCTDPAFCQLRDTLRHWFPPTDPNGDYS